MERYFREKIKKCINKPDKLWRVFNTMGMNNSKPKSSTWKAPFLSIWFYVLEFPIKEKRRNYQ